jgi:hypothetical protein
MTFLGKHHSTESKKKISAAKKGIRVCKRTEFKKGNVPWNAGLEQPRGKDAYHWKGGRVFSGRYFYVYQKHHPNCNKLGYVYEHRLVMEKKLGRFLKATEVVHHKNNNKTDNRIENLKLFKNQSAHRKHHKKGV